MEKDILINLIEKGYSQHRISRELSISQTTTRYWIKKYDLSTGLSSFFRLWTDAEFLDALDGSLSVAEILAKMGKVRGNGGYETLKKHAKRLGVSLPNGNSKGIAKGGRKPLLGAEIFKKDSLAGRGTVKKRLQKEGLGRFCEMCGQSPLWMGKHLDFVLDHKNGIPDDHTRSNLRFVCPNCNSQLDTHCGRNLKRSRKLTIYP